MIHPQLIDENRDERNELFLEEFSKKIVETGGKTSNMTANRCVDIERRGNEGRTNASIDGGNRPMKCWATLVDVDVVFFNFDLRYTFGLNPRLPRRTNSPWPPTFHTNKSRRVMNDLDETSESRWSLGQNSYGSFNDQTTTATTTFNPSASGSRETTILVLGACPACKVRSPPSIDRF